MLTTTSTSFPRAAGGSVRSKTTTTNILVVMILLLLLRPLAVDGAYVRMDRYSLSSYPRALCLDGSPAMYYHHPGGSSSNSKWYIELQGGGWCGSVATCLDRSQTQFGSSNTYNPTLMRNTPFYSDDITINPLMYDWNKVYFRYCDGFSFVGNASDYYDAISNTTLYFRGYDILLAGMEDMLNHRNLSNATDVIVNGCSAGGLASLWTCDLWKSTLQQYSPNVTVKCATESGFFVNYQETTSPTFNDLMDEGYVLHEPILPTNCVSNEPNPTNCLFPQNVVKHLQSPLFVMQSLYDSWARGSIQLSDDNYTSVNAFGQIVVDTIVQSVMTNITASNGIYVDSCKRHGCDGYDVVIDGVKKIEAIQEWYEGGVNVSYVQHEEYLCEACCTGMLPATTTTLPGSSASVAPSATVSAVPSVSVSEVPSPRPSSSSTGAMTSSPSSNPSTGYCPCCCPSSHPSQQRSLLSSIMPSSVVETTASDRVDDTTTSGGRNRSPMGGTMILLIVFFAIVLCGIYMWVAS